jgi:hypothetical protein
MPVPRRPGTLGLLALDVVAALALVYCAIVVVSLALSGVVPLIYDEAWNYLALSNRYIFYPLVRYKVPNNHIFFTFAQSVLVPDFLVRVNPHFLRIPNLLYAGAAVLLSYHVLVRRGGVRIAPFAGAVLAVALVSPLATTYLFVARGYLLGTVLLLAGCYYLSRPPARYPFTGWLLVVGAAWTIPTFGYTLPGLFALHLMRLWSEGRRFEWRRDPLPRVVAILVVVYLPAAHEIVGWTSGASATWGALFAHIRFVVGQIGNFEGSTVAYVVGSVACGLGLLALLVQLPTVLGEPRSEHVDRRMFSVMVLACVASYFACVAALALLGIAKPPYVRHAVFVPLFLVVGVLTWLAHGPSRWPLVMAGVLLALNAIVGIDRLRTTLVAGDPNAYSEFFAMLSATPLSRQLPPGGNGVLEIRPAGPISRRTAMLFHHAFDLPVAEANLAGEVPRCDLGSFPPPPLQRVQILVESGKVLELCF